jgi:hypothetical protein
LRSSLHRRIEEQFEAIGNSPTPEEKQKQLCDEYRSAFYLFRAEGLFLLDPDERDDCGILFAMQHNRVPTRLLDWTESFACALFFAQFERNENEDAVLFVLSVDELNLLTTGYEGLISVIKDPGAKTNVPIANWLPTCLRQPEQSTLNTVAIAPVRTNARMSAQRATFTICGDSFLPLEEQYSSCITKILLPRSLFYDVEGFLEVVGVGPSTYFPDLEGLAMHFRAKHLSEIRYVRRMLRKDSD